MSLELIITIAGLCVAGLAAVLGIWMERDDRKPPRWAIGLSVLILMSTFVSMYQTYQDAKEAEKMQADMARMLQMIDKIANNSDSENPELNDFLKNEMAAQSRSNPKVVEKMAQRVADEGGDPAEVLGRNLPPSEVEALNRKGSLKVKPSTNPEVAKIAAENREALKEKKKLRMERKQKEEEAKKVAAKAPEEDKDAGADEDAGKKEIDLEAVKGLKLTDGAKLGKPGGVAKPGGMGAPGGKAASTAAPSAAPSAKPSAPPAPKKP